MYARNAQVSINISMNVSFPYPINNGPSMVALIRKRVETAIALANTDPEAQISSYELQDINPKEEPHG